MKQFTSTAALVLLTLFVLSGCGKDGNDGDAYFAISWLYDPLYYADDNVGTPAVMVYETYYKTSPGTYTFSYQAWDNSVWWGTYTITVNQGEKGGLFPFDDGSDGAPKHFMLYCYSIGPSLISYKVQNAAAEITKASAAALLPSPAGAVSQETHDTVMHSDGPTVVMEEVQGNMKITVEARKVR